MEAEVSGIETMEKEWAANAPFSDIHASRKAVSRDIETSAR